jgi:DNA-binding NtrC family response regulator
MLHNQLSTAASEGDSATPSKTILLVDDSRDMRSITKLFLSAVGFVVHSFPDAAQALDAFDPAVHNLVVTDNEMPGITGEEMARIIKMRSPATPVVMYSGNCPGNSPYLDIKIQRPASLTVLKNSIDRLLTPRA